MSRNFEKVLYWAKRSLLSGAIGAGLGAAYGSTQIDEGNVTATEAYKTQHTALRAKRDSESTGRVPTAPLPPIPTGLNVAQLTAAIDARRDAVAKADAQRAFDAASVLADQDADRDSARAAVLADGCAECGSRAVEFGKLGALLVGVLPGVVACWFLLLHMLGQASRAMRGQS
jgi:hypothetical protein